MSKPGITTFIAFAGLITLSIIYSCKKSDQLSHPDLSEKELIDKFLTLPTNASPILVRIANDLRKKNEATHFISRLAKDEGFPDWKNVVLKKGLNNSNQQNGEARSNTSGVDTFALIALVSQNQQKINSVLNCRISDSVNYRLFREEDYWKAGFHNQPNTPDADDFVGILLYMENKIYNRSNFAIKDSRLFKANPQANDSGKTQLIRFKRNQISPNGRTSDGLIEIQLCYTVTAPCNGNVTGCPPGDPNCNPYCTTEKCQTIAWWWTTSNTNYNDWLPPDPTGPGNEGTGGTPIVYSLFTISDISRNSISDPCLTAVLSQITDVKLESYIFKQYQNYFVNYSSPYGDNIKLEFRQNSSLIGHSGNPIPGQSTIDSFSVPGTYKWIITLNPLMLQNSSKEFVADVIIHELVHSFISLRWKNVIPNIFDQSGQHIQIFYLLAEDIKNALQELFPNLTNDQAYALAIQGVDDICFENTGKWLDEIQFSNQWAIDHYGISILTARGIAEQFFNGTAGTPC